MANGIRGDISLEKALNVLAGYEPCAISFETYQDMDQSLMAYEVWRTADADDLKWVLAVLGVLLEVPAYKQYRKDRADADLAKSAITGPAFDIWDQEHTKALELGDRNSVREAQRAAEEKRASVCNAAYTAWTYAHSVAEKRYREGLRKHQTYRFALRAVKAHL